LIFCKFILEFLFISDWQTQKYNKKDRYSIDHASAFLSQKILRGTCIFV